MLIILARTDMPLLSISDVQEAVSKGGGQRRGEKQRQAVSNTRAKKSGTQSLSLSRAEHASLQAVSGSFPGSYPLMFARFFFHHESFLFPWGVGTREPSLWVCSPGDVRIPSHVGGYYSRAQIPMKLWVVALSKYWPLSDRRAC